MSILSVLLVILLIIWDEQKVLSYWLTSFQSIIYCYAKRNSLAECFGLIPNIKGILLNIY